MDLKLVPWLRRLMTRLLAIVPAVITIAITGSKGTYQLLVLSQVFILLHYIILYLFYFTYRLLPLVESQH